MSARGIGLAEIAAVGSGWFIWLFLVGPMMWRWHVQLPRARRALEAEPDGPHKERELRRIDLQLGHYWAQRSGKTVFIVIVLLMLASTLAIFVLPSILGPR